jgi:hypothetical protein
MQKVSPLATLRASQVNSVIGEEHKDRNNLNQIAKSKVHIQYPNNDVYKGETRDNMKHGTGEFRDYNKRRIYKGEFLNDYYDGHGKLKYADGKVYEGKFKKGKRHGQGVCYYKVESVIEVEKLDNLGRN